MLEFDACLMQINMSGARLQAKDRVVALDWSYHWKSTNAGLNDPIACS
jgi:hypothetical protein